MGYTRLNFNLDLNLNSNTFMRIFTDFNSKLVAWTALACCLCLLQVEGLSTNLDSGTPDSDGLSSNFESCVDHTGCETPDDRHETFLFNDIPNETVNSFSYDFVEGAMNFPCGSNTVVDCLLYTSDAADE